MFFYTWYVNKYLLSGNSFISVHIFTTHFTKIYTYIGLTASNIYKLNSTFVTIRQDVYNKSFNWILYS